MRTYVHADQGASGHFLTSLLLKERGYDTDKYTIYSPRFNEYCLYYEKGLVKHMFLDNKWITTKSHLGNSLKFTPIIPLHYPKDYQGKKDLKELYFIKLGDTVLIDTIKKLWYIKRRCGDSVVYTDMSEEFVRLMAKKDISNIGRFKYFCRFINETHPMFVPTSFVCRSYFMQIHESYWSADHFHNFALDFYKKWVVSEQTKFNVDPRYNGYHFGEAKKICKHRKAKLHVVDYQSFFWDFQPQGLGIDQYIESDVRPYTQRNVQLIEDWKKYIY